MTEIDNGSDQRKKSVTSGEQKYAVVNHYLLPYLYTVPLTKLPPSPPDYWTYSRDIVLRATLHAEVMWASAIGIAVTKMQSAGYSIKGSSRKVAWAHDLLGNVEFSRGWRYFIARHGQDFLMTDNGAFVEVIRATSGAGSKIVGLAHLDSLRCRRTGDDEIPVVYRDLVGAEHELKWHQVFSVVDMPDPAATLRGVGHCAASRAYQTIYKMSNIECYIAEKAAGRRPLAIHFINNVAQLQLEGAMQSAQHEADKQGLTTYMGAAVVATQNENKPELLTIPLAEIPDRVDVEKERTDTYLRYADAIGLDSQELQPLTGRAMGTATQSQVLDDKERGKFGWFDAFAEQLNLRKITGNATTFAFSQRDWRDQQLEATVKGARAMFLQTLIASTVISADQARQMAADVGDIPKEFITVDATDVETVYDSDNPETEDEAQGQDVQATTPVQAAPQTVRDLAKQLLAKQPETPPSDKRAGVIMAKETSLKARATVDLATLSPGRLDKYPAGSMTESLFLQKVQRELDEYGRLQMLAAQEECPESGKEGETGKTRDSINYAVENKGTRDMSLRWYAGGSERPEVAIRSVLYGRRGFGPKKKGGHLMFEGKDGETVITDHVGPAKANDWWGRAWKKTEPQRRAMAARIGALDVASIKVSDVKRDNAPHIDGYNPNGADKVKAKVVKERE